MRDRNATGAGQWVLLVALTLAWVAGERLLAHYGALALPASIAQHLVLASYLALVQTVSLVVGLGVMLLTLEEPRRRLALRLLSPDATALVLLWAPVVFVATGYVAFELAYDTLLEELARGGREHAESKTGAFGRAITETQAALTLLWAACIAPVAEGIAFRGAAWSAVQELVDRVRGADAPSSLPSELVQEGLLVRGLRSARRLLVSGGIATLVTTAAFAALHADLEGGAGIMRVASAAGLGLAAGIARHASGTVVAPIALHVAFNSMSVASTRRWLVTASLPNEATMPMVLWIAAGSCGIALAGVYLWRFARGARHRS